MKKPLVLLLTVMMLAATAVASAETLVGGWQIAENNAITEENRALLEQALEGLVGVAYVPVAYLGSQVVAGTNHCFLCQATAVYPGAQPTLVLVYLYQDLTGQVEITRMADLDIAAFSVEEE